MTIAEFLKLVRKGDIVGVEQAVKNGFPVDSQNNQGTNGFSAAIKAGKFEMAEWFWNNGVSSMYAEPWTKLAQEKYLDYFIKFDGHKHWNSMDLTKNILAGEKKFVKWAIEKSDGENGQKVAMLANAIRYTTYNNFDGELTLDMLKLCFETLDDITANKNQIMKETWEHRDKLKKEIVEFVMSNDKLIAKAGELKQFDYLPQEAKDIFIF